MHPGKSYVKCFCTVIISKLSALTQKSKPHLREGSSVEMYVQQSD